MKLSEKLLKVQSELNAPKNRENSFGKYNYRSCEDILEAVKPILAKYKASIKLTDRIDMIGDRHYVCSTAYFFHAEDTKNAEDNADLIIAEAYAREPEDKKGMDAAQLTGCSSSYARKYALNGLLLIDDAKDPDTDEFKTESDAKSEKASKPVKKAERKPEKEEVPFESLISAEQVKTLELLLKKADITVEKFNSIYGLAFVSELPAGKYDDAVKKLEAAIVVKKKGEDANV